MFCIRMKFSKYINEKHYVGTSWNKEKKRRKTSRKTKETRIENVKALVKENRLKLFSVLLFLPSVLTSH